MANHSSSSFTNSSPSSPPFSPPSSILIIGSGVFGLSTAYALARRDVFSQTSITVVDRAASASDRDPVFPARDSSSIDSSRIIRADYADPAYTKLAAEAQRQWRQAEGPDDLGAEGRYTESGLVMVADGTPPENPPTDHGALPAQRKKAKKSGMDYARASWENVVALSAQDPELAGRIRELPDPAAIRDAVGTGGTSGSWGYLNGCAGWANAEKSMSWLYEKVRRTARVEFVCGTVSRLVHNGETVTGANLADGRTLSADLVILATGAWTASLLDLAGQASATGQVLAYMDITEEEQEQLGKMPTLLNLTTGLFIIPPANRVLKVARHSYGYLNPTDLAAAPLPPTLAAPTPANSGALWTVSYPRTSISDPDLLIPSEGVADLRRALREMIPLPALHDRPFTSTRLCWYTDTAAGDFIISHHPRYAGLFVATGGSGHGFKFLPVIGDKIVDTIVGRCPAEFREKWVWKEMAGRDPVATEDGTRGGKPGLILADELRKPRTAQ